MESNHANLFQEFKPVSQSEWEEKIEKDLKGKGLSSLQFKPEFDLEAKANYHPDEFTEQQYSNGNILNNNNNDWAISQAFSDSNSKETNSAILKALNTGCTGLKIYTSSTTNFQDLFQNVMIAHVFTHVIIESSSDYKRLLAYLDTVNEKLSIIEMPFLTSGLNIGALKMNQLEIDNFIEDSANYCIKNVIIDGHAFCQFGASTAQELGITLSMLNECFQRLMNQEIAPKHWEDKIAIHLGVTDNYFVNIAKFRAIKELILQLKAQWNLNVDSMPWVSAETVERHMAINDRYNNVLRQTASAMSAVMGGISQLIVRPYSKVTNNDAALSARLSKNIQLILKEESYLNQVIDPSAGSYVIESLTDQLITRGWEYFRDIEKEGGYYDALESGFIHSQVEASKNEQIAAMNKGEKTLLGVNKFQNSNETWQSTTSTKTPENIDFKAFTVFNLESNFKKLPV